MRLSSSGGDLESVKANVRNLRKLLEQDPSNKELLELRESVEKQIEELSGTSCVIETATTELFEGENAVEAPARRIGRVVMVNIKKGFGFIRPDPLGEEGQGVSSGEHGSEKQDVCVHRKSVVMAEGSSGTGVPLNENQQSRVLSGGWMAARALLLLASIVFVVPSAREFSSTQRPPYFGLGRQDSGATLVAQTVLQHPVAVGIRRSAGALAVGRYGRLTLRGGAVRLKGKSKGKFKVSMGPDVAAKRKRSSRGCPKTACVAQSLVGARTLTSRFSESEG